MDWQKYIHSDSPILLGKPTVKGTRLSIEFLLGGASQLCKLKKCSGEFICKFSPAPPLPRSPAPLPTVFLQKWDAPLLGLFAAGWTEQQMRTSRSAV